MLQHALVSSSLELLLVLALAACLPPAKVEKEGAGAGGDGRADVPSAGADGVAGIVGVAGTANTPDPYSVRLPPPLRGTIFTDDGIAFASTPSIRRLSITLTVRHPTLPTGWRLIVSQPWLSAVGDDPDDSDDPDDPDDSDDPDDPDVFVLSANPSGLALDETHFAELRIETDDGSAELLDRARVGFWVGSAAPESVARVAVAYTEVIADPIRPLAYAHGGSAPIDVYNIHTAALVRSIRVPAEALGAMAIESDGDGLFVVDASEGGGVFRIDLDDDAVGEPSIEGRGKIAFTRCDGRGLLLSAGGSVLSLETPAAASTFAPDSLLAVSQNGNAACALNEGISPYTLTCYSIDCRSSPTPSLVPLSQVSGAVLEGVGSNGADVALSAWGDSIYVASAAPPAFVRYANTLIPQQQFAGAAYPNNVELNDDGRVLAAADAMYAPADFWVYERDGNLLRSLDVTPGYAKSPLRGQLRGSGDGLRAIILTNDPLLEFITLEDAATPAPASN